ncbi:MAG: DUF2461 domain-containing protein [Rhodothermales bacterium]
MATALNDLPPFPGIRDEGLDFLTELRKEEHQDRDWFNERKLLYTDELRWPLRCLVVDVVRSIESDARVTLHGDPRKSVFRIYRDVRFTNDKRPYQTHVACKWTVNADLQDEDGLVYLHIEPPENMFIAAGIYNPPVKRLRPLRNKLVESPSLWKDIEARLVKEGLTPTSHGDDLTNMPRGFAEHKDHELADLLKWTSLLVTEELPRSAVQSTSLTNDVLSFARRAWPLLQFIRDTR